MKASHYYTSVLNVIADVTASDKISRETSPRKRIVSSNLWSALGFLCESKIQAQKIESVPQRPTHNYCANNPRLDS